MVEFISDTALVRRLARNVSPLDFTDAQVISEQKMAFSKIGIKTGKWDWNAVIDVERFPAIQKDEEMLAAAYILMHYGSGSQDEVNWIQFWMDTVKDDLQTTVDEGVDTEADANVLTATSNYESYPASLQDDINAVPYRSTNEML